MLRLPMGQPSREEQRRQRSLQKLFITVPSGGRVVRSDGTGTAAGGHLQQGWVRRGVTQLPCFCQLNGMLPLQLLIEQHDTGFWLIVFTKQDLLQVFAVEIF